MLAQDLSEFEVEVESFNVRRHEDAMRGQT